MFSHRPLYLFAAASALCVGLVYRPALADGNFYERSAGGFVLTEPPPMATVNLEQFLILQKGPISFQFLLMHMEHMTQPVGPDTVEGTFIFIGDSQTDTLQGTVSGTNIDDGNGTWTGVGSWIVTSGTGAFEGFGGSGTYTTALLFEDGSAATAFDGDIIVPTPAAGVVLGAGVLGLCRRRRAARI
jgi:hypothetical protein